MGYPTFASPHARPIAIHGDHVFVVNTPADTVDILDRGARKLLARVKVGVDPVSVAIRPDGREIWVANHISDSVSVIDNVASSSTHWQVVATIQELDDKTKSTRFDEPVGIAFADNQKAYVALSSENQVAVIDVGKRRVKKLLTIPAQDPRAIAVRGDRLYVLPFESNNKTQLSGGAADDIDGDLVTFDAWQHSIRVNNVLSLGHVTDIVKHPDVPDKDLFVYDTATDELIETVDTLGTLLYGLAINSRGDVFVAQTDARNEANGRSGTRKHGLEQLENRAFLNQITQVSFKDGAAEEPRFMDLEPLPPKHPDREKALATPFAIQVSHDDRTLVVTAAGSDKLFTVDTESGEVLGRITVGAVPRGIALEHDKAGELTTAWVYNAVANTVSVVDLSNPADPAVEGFVSLDDPTPRRIKLGRTWFNDAAASTTATFSCASCHPDGHTDQLLWVLKTPIVTGGDQIMPRSTMPIRGLRDTAPFHWDGIPGDPYGGNNSANIHGEDPPNSSPDDPASTTRHLIDGGLASTMLLEGDKTINDEGKSGAFTAAERDDMAQFILNLPYPPAQRRAFDNVVSDRAMQGFRLFHIDGDFDPSRRKPNVCGDCHRMPHLVSTGTPGTGMDAPTWRGAYDRFLILPQGRLNIMEFDFYARAAHRGQPERDIWQFSWAGRRRFDPVWDMVLEGSTGYSGSFARQVTVSQTTVGEVLTKALLEALEQSAREESVVLEAEGVIHHEAEPQVLALQFDPSYQEGVYVRKDGDRRAYTREELMSLALAGHFVGTFTGRQGAKSDAEHPQPVIWTQGPIEQQRGAQDFPVLHPGQEEMIVSGRYLDTGARVVVNGRLAKAKVTLGDNEHVTIRLADLPSPGLHLIQVQNPDGLLSNDFLFHVVENVQAVARLKERLKRSQLDVAASLGEAIGRGDLAEVRKRLAWQMRWINERRPGRGATPLSTAALHGRLEIAKFLMDKGAKVNATNHDGNTPLHVAAFLCRTNVVNLLLQNGASPTKKNQRGETPIDVVSSPWTEELAGFYTGIGQAVGLKLDLKRIQQERPALARALREHQAQSGTSSR